MQPGPDSGAKGSWVGWHADWVPAPHLTTVACRRSGRRSTSLGSMCTSFLSVTQTRTRTSSSRIGNSRCVCNPMGWGGIQKPLTPGLGEGPGPGPGLIWVAIQSSPGAGPGLPRPPPPHLACAIWLIGQGMLARTERHSYWSGPHPHPALSPLPMLYPQKGPAGPVVSGLRSPSTKNSELQGRTWLWVPQGIVAMASLSWGQVATRPAAGWAFYPKVSRGLTNGRHGLSSGEGREA